jgi:hypothetical protein
MREVWGSPSHGRSNPCERRSVFLSTGWIVGHSEKAGVAAAIEPAHEERYRTISEADWTLPQGREGLKRNAETALAGTGIPRQGYRDIRPRMADFRAASFRLPLVRPLAIIPDRCGVALQLQPESLRTRARRPMLRRLAIALRRVRVPVVAPPTSSFEGRWRLWGRPSKNRGHDVFLAALCKYEMKLAIRLG